MESGETQVQLKGEKRVVKKGIHLFFARIGIKNKPQVRENFNEKENEVFIQIQESNVVLGYTIFRLFLGRKEG